MHGQGVGVHGWGVACMAGGGVAKGGVCGKGGHAWQRGACMARGCVW